MAAMTTALTEFSDSANSRTYVLSTHTAEKPHLVIQKRKVAASATGVSEDVIQTLRATEDAAGNVLSSKVLIETRIRRPVNGDAADVTAALATHRDIIAGDEFTATVSGQVYLK